MRVLMIGGTGTISAPITEQLAGNKEVELYVLNRGHKALPEGAIQLIGDMNDEAVMEKIASEHDFDVVMNFVIYEPEQAQKQLALFRGRISQYIFISTVVTYDHDESIEIRENHKQGNPLSVYGQKKIACEKVFLAEGDFPLTIVRPSQTYGGNRIPLSVKGNSCYSVLDRILNDKPVIVHGDGQSIWHCTHANDFAKGFLPLVGNTDAIHQAFNLVNPEVVTWNQIYRLIYKHVGKEPKIIHIASDLLAESAVYNNKESILGDKTNSNYYSTDKLKTLVPDFRCDINIETGIQLYLDYLEAHPEEKVPDEKYDRWCDKVIESYEQYCEAFSKTF